MTLRLKRRIVRRRYERGIGVIRVLECGHEQAQGYGGKVKKVVHAICPVCSTTSPVRKNHDDEIVARIERGFTEEVA
jgi:hypothetical protein